MKPRTADKIIAAGRPVVVTSGRYRETFKALFIARDGSAIVAAWTQFADDPPLSGGRFDRADLELVTE